MKRIKRVFDKIFRWVSGHVSSVFIVMLVASFVLWYLSKLNYTYTTEHDVLVHVDGQSVDVCCVIEGLGTNLLGYKINRRTQLRVPLSELKYRRVRNEGDEQSGYHVEIDKQSLQDAIATRCSDIKIVSIKDSLLSMPLPKQ